MEDVEREKMWCWGLGKVKVVGVGIKEWVVDW